MENKWNITSCFTKSKQIEETQLKAHHSSWGFVNVPCGYTFQNLMWIPTQFQGERWHMLNSTMKHACAVSATRCLLACRNLTIMIRNWIIIMQFHPNHLHIAKVPVTILSGIFLYKPLGKESHSILSKQDSLVGKAMFSTNSPLPLQST